MDGATIALTVMSGFILLVFAGFLIWGLRSGQFHNSEEAKYKMFEDHDIKRTNFPGATKDRGEHHE